MTALPDSLATEQMIVLAIALYLLALGICIPVMARLVPDKEPPAHMTAPAWERHFLRSASDIFKRCRSLFLSKQIVPALRTKA